MGQGLKLMRMTQPETLEAYKIDRQGSNLSHLRSETTDSVGQLFLGAPNWEEQAHGKSRSPLGVQNMPNRCAQS